MRGPFDAALTIQDAVDAVNSIQGLYYALVNCILYENFASGINSNYGTGNLTFSYCCLQPLAAGMNPTNGASVLTMNSAGRQPGYNRVVVKWQGVSTRDYLLQRSSDLSGGFVIIQTNITGSDGANLYLDITATRSEPCFHRAGVPRPASSRR